MTITKRVELDLIGFNVDTDPVNQGKIQIRRRLMELNPVTEKWVAVEYHRTDLDADMKPEDIDRQLEADAVHLEGLGFGRPPDTDRGYIDDAINRAWTPEVKTAVATDRQVKKEAYEAKLVEDEANAKKDAEEQQARDEARFAEWAERAGMVPKK